MKAGIDYVAISTSFYCNDGKGNLLLHKRSKKCRDEQGRWDPGGGQLEFGLTPEENVLKEIKEEYGCRGKIQRKLPAYSLFRKIKDKNSHWLIIPFFVRVNPKQVKINDPEKIDEIGWFKLNGLPRPLHTGFKFALKNYKKYFSFFS